MAGMAAVNLTDVVQEEPDVVPACSIFGQSLQEAHVVAATGSTVTVNHAESA